MSSPSSSSSAGSCYLLNYAITAGSSSQQLWTWIFTAPPSGARPSSSSPPDPSPASARCGQASRRACSAITSKLSEKADKTQKQRREPHAKKCRIALCTCGRVRDRSGLHQELDDVDITVAHRCVSAKQAPRQRGRTRVHAEAAGERKRETGGLGGGPSWSAVF